MERRGCGLGCIISGLGLMLALCLAPYLISSIYSIITSLLPVPVTANWLWGDWLNTFVGENEILYMLLAEGPMCCVGTIGLLIIILGLVMMISGLGQDEEHDAEEMYDYPQEW
jgi:hypothetical protein